MSETVWDRSDKVMLLWFPEDYSDRRGPGPAGPPTAAIYRAPWPLSTRQSRLSHADRAHISLHLTVSAFYTAVLYSPTGFYMLCPLDLCVWIHTKRSKTQRSVNYLWKHLGTQTHLAKKFKWPFFTIKFLFLKCG